jgi:PKD repeat protein
MNDTTYIITLISVNECGADTASHVITVYPNTVTAFFNTDTTSGCEPLTVNFTNFATAPYIAWDFGDGNQSNVLSPVHTFFAPGTYTVAQYVNNGCSFDTAFAEITVYPGPEVSFTSDPSICPGYPISFNNTSVGSTGYLWEFGDGDTSHAVHPQHIFQNPGTYTVVLTAVSNVNGCVGSFSKNVTVFPWPEIQLTPSDSDGCAPLVVQFGNASSGAYHFWDFGDGNTSVAAAPVHTFQDSGLYYIHYTVTDINGCTRDTFFQILAYEVPESNFIPEVDSLCGVPAMIPFVNLSSGTQISFEWDFGNGTGSNLNNPTATYLSTGIYPVSLVVTNTYGCRDTSSREVSIFPQGMALFEASPTFGCSPLTVTFTDFSSNATDWYWDFGDGNLSNLPSPVHTYDSGGVYSVQLTVFYQGVCGDTLFVNDQIYVEQSPVADFSYESTPPANVQDGTVTFTNLTIYGDTYYWDFGDGFFSTEKDPVHRYDINGPITVSLLVSNSAGCEDSIQKVIFPSPFGGLQIPNAFAPLSGAGDAAIFKPVGVGLVEYEIAIYSVWGDLIWSSSLLEDGKPAEFWDGTINGQLASLDAFVWKVHKAIFVDGSGWKGMSYRGEKPQRTGTLTLIR